MTKAGSQRLVQAGQAALLGALILLPAYFSHGSLLIGGDSILPFDAEGIGRYLWQWLNIQNGAYWEINYFSQYLYYKIFELFTADVYLKSTLLLVMLRALSVAGVYRLLKIIDPKAGPAPYFLASVFYLLSPVNYNAWAYLQIYAFIPWFFYFTLKIVRTGKLAYWDVIWMNAIIFAASLDLPNPKYIFHLFLILGVALAAAIWRGELKSDFLIRNKWKIALFFLISSYLYVPLVYFILNYSAAAYGTAVRAGYTNEAGVKMMDYGTATADKMFRLFHDGMVISPLARLTYLSLRITTISNFFFAGLIAWFFAHKRERAFLDWLSLLLALIYLAFAIGPNPPFGFIYEALVTKISLLAFLRTTAGAVFFLSLFYTILLFSALKHFRSSKLNALFVGSLLLTSYPLVTGEYYRNWSPVNHFIKTDEYGLKVPEPYFQMKRVLDAKKLDARVLLPNTNLTYVNTTWGYFGPAALYHYLYKSYFTSADKIIVDHAKHNIGYVLKDSSLYPEQPDQHGSALLPDAVHDFMQLSAVPRERFLPVVYTPSAIIQTFYSDEPVAVDAAILGLDSPLQLEFSDIKPIIEYRKIAPTKFRIIAHGVRSDFMLILSEQFHGQWKLYLGDAPARAESLKGYQLLPGNEREQATRDEAAGFLEKGWLTAAGNRFISKSNYGTIQNDNLPSGPRFETLFAPRLSAEHRLTNYYANSWIIRVGELRKLYPDKVKINGDGTIDIELIAAFLPQTILELSALLSAAALALAIALGLRSYGHS